VKFVARYGVMSGRYRSTLGSNFHLFVSRFKFNQWAFFDGCVNAFTILCGHVEDILLLNRFFPIVDMCLSCEHIARQSCAMVPRWRFLATFLRPVFFSEPRAAGFRPAS